MAMVETERPGSPSRKGHTTREERKVVGCRDGDGCGRRGRRRDEVLRATAPAAAARPRQQVHSARRPAAPPKFGGSGQDERALARMGHTNTHQTFVAQQPWETSSAAIRTQSSTDPPSHLLCSNATGIVRILAELCPRGRVHVLRCIFPRTRSFKIHRRPHRAMACFPRAQAFLWTHCRGIVRDNSPRARRHTAEGRSAQGSH
jgi:hypothetical protein